MRTKHTDNQFHQENIRNTKTNLCSAIYLMHTRAKALQRQLRHMAVRLAVELEHSLRNEERISILGQSFKSGRRRTESKCGDDGG